MTELDSRSWLVWAVCAMVPLLLSRHPVVVGTMLLIVLTVRFACFPNQRHQWRWIARVAVIVAVIGVVFNTLTVRSGNQVLGHIPGTDWSITWNAIAFGLVSGLALVTLVLTGITAAAGLDWIALSRVLPRRLAPLAVSGSVAWAFLPAAGQSVSEIREAQIARGHQIRSGRDVLPLVVPLLDTGMGRALTMAEALEARGFGAAPQRSHASRGVTPLYALVALAGVIIAAFAMASGYGWVALAAIAVALPALSLWSRRAPVTPPITRYRSHQLTIADAVVMAGALASLVAYLIIWRLDPGVVVFNPYPNLTLQPTNAWLLIGLAGLLLPAAFPRRGEQE